MIFFSLSFAVAGECVASAGLECPPQSLLDNVDEACAYRIVYDLAPALNSNFGGTAPSYTVDASSHSSDYDRVAYYMEVDGDWAWVSMPDFTTSLTELGVPDASLNPVQFQQIVTDMTVASNVAGVVQGSGIDTGNLEIWPSCYGQGNAASVPGASGSTYDLGDLRNPLGNCYGSLQVHNHGASQTVFAWSGFQHALGDDFTIGNASGTHPDGTFGNGFAGTTSRRYLALAR
ncbi:MAG: hypothetical protein KC656_30065, partial [Myxococcales bacterium]|nr:hypothetical protein [Myxococcales bacterium]